MNLSYYLRLFNGLMNPLWNGYDRTSFNNDKSLGNSAVKWYDGKWKSQAKLDLAPTTLSSRCSARHSSFDS
jgi:hypothetical protein